MIKGLAELFAGKLPPDVYIYTSRARPDSLEEALAREGWLGFHLNGERIASKRSFLNACARAMSFPSYFGHNWDALEDSLRDLSWIPAQGHVLLYDHAARFATGEPDQWPIALDILRSAVAARREMGIPPLYVFLRGAGRQKVDLPRL